MICRLCMERIIESNRPIYPDTHCHHGHLLDRWVGKFIQRSYIMVWDHLKELFVPFYQSKKIKKEK